MLTVDDPGDSITPNCCLDTIHAAFTAGYDIGYAKGRQAAVEDLARALLREQALEMQDTAVQTARDHYGDAWAQAIAEQVA